MNFDLTEDQEMMRETFAQFLSDNSSTARVRAALPLGFDAALWKGLGELGALSIRVPEAAGGLGLGVFEASLLMDEAGRTLASGPLAETLVATRLLAMLGGGEDLLARTLTGEAIVSIAYHDVARRPKQWIAGGAMADAVIARDGEQVVLVSVPSAARKSEPNLASTPIAELDLKSGERKLLSSGPEGLKAFAQGLEEWKLLMAAALSGLAREAVRLASAYASERIAFGQPIGVYQAISHPLADLITDVDGGKFLVWKALRDLADNKPNAGAEISLAIWWNADMAARAVAHALHVFGGYGLTTEYDIHLYNLRAKAWPLLFGDPQLFLEEAGRRLYAGERAALPDVGAVAIEFDLGDEARSIVKEIDAFMEKNMTPAILARTHYSWEGHIPEFHQALAKADLLYLGFPKDLGGRGLSSYARNAAMERFEHWGWNNPVANVAQMVGLIVARFGSDDAKRDILPKILAGEVICSLGYSEPGSGSDVFAAQCKATPEGNGWRIDGTKMFTSGANLTDYVLMLTRTNADVAKHKGLTMFLVPLKTEGVAIQPVYTFMDERTNITFYDGVHIPDSLRLGGVDAGVKTMSASLELEHGGGFTKVQRKMIEAGEALCREIKLIDQPQAQKRLARMEAHTLISEMLGYRAMWVGVEKKPNLAYGPMIKMFSSEKFLIDSRDLLDLTAPYSLAKRDGPAAYINERYRHAHGTTIYGGTSEVHRSMIAERTLGLPRSRG